MNILLVDDHPMIIEGYQNALMRLLKDQEALHFTVAHDCEKAYNIVMQNRAKNKHFTLAIVDQGLPPYAEAKIETGTDLSILIRKYMPLCKIMMVTAHTEVVIIYDIIRKLNPEGLIIKKDITPDNINDIFNSILTGTLYQSSSVKSCVSEIWRKQLMIEDYNRQILFYLSRGYKVKEIEQVVPLGMSAIQKRIILMKSAFNTMDNGSLVKEAILQGFI